MTEHEYFSQKYTLEAFRREQAAMVAKLGMTFLASQLYYWGNIQFDNKHLAEGTEHDNRRKA